MTEKECIALLDRYANYDGMGIPKLAGCREAMKMAVELLSQPSLPPDVDEAAHKYAWEKQEHHIDFDGEEYLDYGPRYDAFKAGAAYEAGKGETLIAKVKINGMGRANLALENVYLNSGYGYKEGDKVKVQIKPKV